MTTIEAGPDFPTYAECLATLPPGTDTCDSRGGVSEMGSDDAEGTDASAAAPLLPMIGVPIAHGIRVLHERCNVDTLDAAELLDATAIEMREARPDGAWERDE